MTVNGGVEVGLHLKLPGELPLAEAHEVASQVERAIAQAVPAVVSVQTHLEPLREAGPGERLAEADQRAVAGIVRELTGEPPREVRFIETEDGVLLFVTVRIAGGSLAEAHERASEIEERIRAELPGGRRRRGAHRAVKLCMFSPKGADLQRGWPGRIEGDRVIQLAAQTLQSFFTGGGKAREHAEYPLAEVELRPPVLHPPSVRDFYAFEQHVKTARAKRGLEVPEEWYRIPVFYFSNPSVIYGPEAEIPYPDGTNELDYELEVAAVIGADGQIGGFTIMNDWSARDVQREEMKVGLGPAKGKDFATSLGPVVVTPDEFDGSSAVMVARVNGEERSRGNLADLYHPWDRIVEQAGRNTELWPGDILGSGTVGTGCILEHGDGRWLQPGDEVELEVEGIGVLRNTIGPR